MTRAGRLVATSFLAVVMAVSSSGVAAAEEGTSSACEGDPTGVNCVMEALAACGDVVTIEGIKVYVTPEAVGCYLNAVCAVDSPCRQLVRNPWQHCTDPEVCEALRGLVVEAIQFVVERLPLICPDLACRTT
ncbi:MAG TPA: hypothetical protein VG318_16035 [Actinomycetota bacterium]|nr:hypothetical protein [Actinomycetota bacterium]